MIDFSKPLQTRDGRNVTIYTTTAKSSRGFCVVGDIDYGGDPQLGRWTVDGRFFGCIKEQPSDLINILQRFIGSRWLAIFHDGPGYGLHKTLKDAQRVYATAAAYVEVKWDVEEGANK